MINIDHFREEIILPTLAEMYDEFPSSIAAGNAVELLIGTAIQESRLTYLKQIGGPALGLYQIEPATLSDVYDNYLNSRRDRLELIEQMLSPLFSREDQLASNLIYATAIARIIYWRKPGAIPDTLEGQADYWKEHYNTPLGKGTAEQYINNYKRYVEV